MKKFAILFLLFFTVISAQQKLSIGYYYASNDTYRPEEINYKGLTHIVHAFVTLKSNGGLEYDSWFFNDALVAEAHKNNVPILAAVGGWGNSENFPAVVADDALRKNFIDKLIHLCEVRGYDGIDLDWEYPGAEDKANFVTLVKELRSAIDSAGFTYVTAALPSTDWSNAYDITELKKYLDWFGIMTYDYYGPWEANSGHVSPLYSNARQAYSTVKSIQTYLDKGVPKEQLCMGIPFYGYDFETSGLYNSASSGASVSYVTAMNYANSGWQYNWDNASKAPYLINPEGTRLLTFDDTLSVKLKTNYLYKKNIAGTIIWKIGQDYDGTEAELLNTLEKYLVHPPVNAPQIPQPVGPVNGASAVDLPALLSWNVTDSTTHYEIELATDGAFSETVRSSTLYPFPEIKMTGLDAETEYFWRVKSVNSSGESEWSDIYSFTTGYVSAVEERLAETGETEERIEVYPNPFNSTINIRYILNESGDVNLHLYNILGEKVQTLFSGVAGKGEHEMKVNMESLKGGTASGVYLLVLRTNSNMVTKKILYSK